MKQTLWLAKEPFPVALKPTLLSSTVGHIGTWGFQDLFLQKPNGTLATATKRGNFSCAWFMVAPLLALELISRTESYVEPMIDRLFESGWFISPDPEQARIVVWAAKPGSDGDIHLHIGLCLDTKWCISNDNGSPQRHRISGYLHNVDGSERAVLYYLAHPGIEADTKAYEFQEVDSRWRLVDPISET